MEPEEESTVALATSGERKEGMPLIQMDRQKMVDDLGNKFRSFVRSLDIRTIQF